MFDKIKSMMFEDDTAQPKATATSQASTPTVLNTTQSVPMGIVPSGGFSEDFRNRLMQVMQDNNQTGFDYLEFKQALLNMQSIPMSEKDKYASVHAVASTAGAQLNYIISSIDIYKQKLEEEKARFQQAVESQKSTEVENRESQKLSNESTIKQLYDKISEMNAQITSLNNENAKLGIEISEHSAKIANVETSFNITYNTVMQQLDEDKQKITTYLGTTVTSK